MAQQTINNGETGLNVRTKLNSNFTEVYTAGSTSLTRMNNHVGGTAERHNASDVVNNSAVTGARVNNALDTLKGTIDSAVLAASNANIGVYSINASGTDTLTGTVSDLTYFGGLKINLTIANNNTGAVTFNLNALGAKNLRKLDGTGTKVALEPRDLLAGKVAQLEYDGTDFILINAKDVATYSAEQTETVEVASLPNTAVEGEVDAVVKGATVVNLLGSYGDFEGDDAISFISRTSSSLTISKSTSYKVYNQKSMRVVHNLTSSHFMHLINVKVDPTKKYIIRFDYDNLLASGRKVFGLQVKNNTTSIPDLTAWSSVIDRLAIFATDTTDTRVRGVFCDKLSPSNSEISIQLRALTVTSANDDVMYLDGLMITEIPQSDYDNLTTDQLLDKYPYVNDIKHVEANRVKVVGKNLFDKDDILQKGLYDNPYVLTSDGSSISFSSTNNNTRSVSGFIRVKPNTTYFVDSDSLDYNVTGGNFRVGAYSERTMSSVISLLQVNRSGGNFTTPAGTNYIKIEFRLDQLEGYQLELGSTATTYEPYTETTRYFDKSLKSLPNGTKDTIDNNGLYTKRLSDLQDITGTTYASIDTATYTDVDVVKTTAFSAMRATTTGADGFTKVLNKDGVELSEVAQADIDLTASVGKYYVHTDKTIWFIVADGTYADVDGARTGLGTSKAMFELATPTTEQLPLQPLQSQASGTIYNEPVTRELLTYATGLTLTNDLRKADKNFIESLFKVDGETKTPIALADVTVASATSLTISGANDDEQYEIVYEVELGNSTRAELTYSYPLDNVAQLDDVSKITFKTNKELRDFINYQNAVNVVFDARITAVEP
jgi:hypothetical protein